MIGLRERIEKTNQSERLGFLGYLAAETPSLRADGGCLGSSEKSRPPGDCFAATKSYLAKQEKGVSGDYICKFVVLQHIPRNPRLFY